MQMVTKSDRVGLKGIMMQLSLWETWVLINLSKYNLSKMIMIYWNPQKNIYHTSISIDKPLLHYIDIMEIHSQHYLIIMTCIVIQ